MSCIGRRLSAAPRAALPHQKIAQRRGRIYEQLRRDPDRANINKLRREGGRRKNTACPHQQDQHPMPSASDVRTTPSSKGQMAARVLRQLSQDGHRAPPKHRCPSKIIHPPNSMDISVRQRQCPQENGESDRAHMGKRRRARQLSNRASDL